jgi:hypothetical protein
MRKAEVGSSGHLHRTCMETCRLGIGTRGGDMADWGLEGLREPRITLQKPTSTVAPN